MDRDLLDLLVCPADHGELTYAEAESRLVCSTCQRSYPVEDGIPIMLVENP